MRGPPNIEERVARVERGLERHFETLSAHNDALANQERRAVSHGEILGTHGQRLATVEEADRKREIAEIRKEEREIARSAAIDVVIADVKQDVGSIKSGISRLVWIVVTAVTLALAAFVLKGGLT